MAEGKRRMGTIFELIPISCGQGTPASSFHVASDEMQSSSVSLSLPCVNNMGVAQN